MIKRRITIMLLAPDHDIIHRIEILPPEALKELRQFIDFLYFSYKVRSPAENAATTISTPNPLAALAGCWEGELIREPQGTFEVRRGLD
jgi:hypothetical protein